LKTQGNILYVQKAIREFLCVKRNYTHIALWFYRSVWTLWQLKLSFSILAALRRLQLQWRSVCMSCHCTKIYRIVFGKRLMLCCRNMTASLHKKASRRWHIYINFLRKGRVF